MCYELIAAGINYVYAAASTAATGGGAAGVAPTLVTGQQVATGVQATTMIAGAASAYSSYQGQAAQAEFASDQARNNALAAQYAQETAALANADHRRQLRERTRGQVGRARSALAGGNVVLGAGTAGDIETQLEVAGAQDMFQLEQNFALQQQGISFQRQNLMSEARNLSRTGSRYRSSSLLAAGGTFSKGMS